MQTIPIIEGEQVNYFLRYLSIKAQRLVWSFAALVLPLQVHAFDLYQPESGQLTIPVVSAYGVYYKNVVITLGEVLSIEGGTPQGNFDRYNSLNNILEIPQVSVGGIFYNNVKITLGKILFVGGSTTELTQTASAFDKTPLVLPDMEPVYANFCPTSPNGRALQHVVPVDVNRDGRMDLILFLWCSPVPGGANFKGVTPSRIVVLMQDAQGKFEDGTLKTFGASKIEPGGVGEYYVKGDFNGDGYVDVVWSLQREDGRSINNPPLTQYSKNIALMSQGNGSYSMVEFGEPGWGFGLIALDNATGGQDLVAISSSHSAQGWTYSKSNGWTAISGFDWVGGNGSVFLNGSPVGAASTLAVSSVLNSLQVGVQLYKSVAGIWEKAGGFMYPASVIQKLCCNNAQASGATFVSLDGKDYIDPSFGFTCQIRRTPKSSPEVLTVFEAQEIVGGYRGQLVVYGQTVLKELFKILSFSPTNGNTLTRNTLVIRNEIQQDVKANRMACMDINGDGYDDIILYVSKNNQTPIVYLNDGTGSFDLVAASIFVPSPDYGGEGLSNYVIEDINRDGIIDLIYFPIVGTAGTQNQIKIYKGTRMMGEIDVGR